MDLFWYKWLRAKAESPPPQAEKKWRKPYKSVKVWKNCHADKVFGRDIYCPECNAVALVYNMAWSALTCTNCYQSNNKYSWYTIRTEKELKRQLAKAIAKTGSNK